MLLTQGQGRRIERVVGNGTPGTGLIGGFQAVRLIEEPPDQSPDRAWAKVQRVSDGGGGLAATGAVEDETTKGQGE